MANYKIEDVEGIGPVTGEKFRAASIADTDALLAAATTAKQRAELAAKVGLSEAKILRFANMVDLYRVKGVGSEYSELLEAAGVDTVPELAQRNAANLAKALAAVNEVKKLTRQVPSETEVGRWIEHAKTLPRVLQY
jgi:predicted flap endonuclease-1-like 5' DNA nuclease